MTSFEVVGLLQIMCDQMVALCFAIISAHLMGFPLNQTLWGKCYGSNHVTTC